MRTVFQYAAVLLVGIGLGDSPSFADDFDELVKLQTEVHDLTAAGRFKDAVPRAEELVARARKALADQPLNVAACLNDLAVLYNEQGQYSQAEPLFDEIIAIRQRHLGPADEDIADTLNNLANLYRNERRFAEAEPLFKRSLAIREKAVGPEHPKFAATLSNLGNLYRDQGRFGDAEPLFKRAIAIDEKTNGQDHEDTAGDLNNLAILYVDQGRYDEAEALYNRAGSIRFKILGAEHPLVADSLQNLAILFDNQQRYAEAEPLYRKALGIQEKALGPDHPLVGRCIQNLATLLNNQGRYAEAETLFQLGLAAQERLLGSQHPEVASILNNLAVLYDRQGRYAEAEKFADRALAMVEKTSIEPGLHHTCNRERAEICWKLGKRDQAVDDLRRAMDFAEQTRIQVSGSEKQRADNFSRYISAYELMFEWQFQLHQPAEAFAAAERSRARSLMDQLAAANVDELAGLPEAEAKQLRRREADAKTRLAQLQKQAELNSSDAAIQRKMAAAQQEVIETYDAIRNANPAHRQMVGRDFKPAGVEEIQQTVVGPQGLLLEYFLGLKDGYVVVVPAPGESPRIERLSIDETQAKILGVKPGPLTGDLMHAILNFNSGGGERKVGTARGRGLDLMDDDRDAAGLAILPLLRRADHAMQAVDKLAALWQVLIPKTEREAIVSGKLQRLVIVPDGALAPLPFEVLVVESGAQPKYLLDAGPAIVGGPSATLLLNLSKERATVKNPQRQVLSVGDANYGPAASAGRVPTVLAQLTARSRYGALHDQLQPLPFTGLECTWVADNFKGQGMDAGILRKDAAREASVRLYAPGCRVLHFACHGLTDQRYGNLFGALALTPGPDAVDANDDGFLTLAEIYALDLRGCDLAILSACDTNYGPQEWGEGVWSLSRGFIVAGSQRVVASSWLVDDEAAASLVSVFCSSVAKEQKAGTPDYADALQKAKRWVRNQEKWSSPFYWGTFVLVGPN